MSFANCVHTFLLGVELVNQIIYINSTAINLYSHQQGLSIPGAAHLCQPLIMSVLFILAMMDMWWWHCGFNFYFL